MGKYVKYAFGEIFLVVVGILIALQINNWNEERNRSNQEYLLLLSLKSDFLNSQKRLQETMIKQKNVIIRSSALIKIHEGTLPLPSIDSLKTFIQFGAFSWYRAELVTGAYDALINAGDSELIKNNELTRELAEYFSILNSGFEDQETSMNLLNNMQIIAEPILLTLSLPQLRKDIGLADVSNPKEEVAAIKFLFKQKSFFGHLYNKTAIEKLRFDLQNELAVRIIKIVSIIDQELKNHNN